MVNVFVALVWNRKVGKAASERTIVRINPVAEQVVGCAIRVAGAEAERLDERAGHRAVSAREGSKLNVRDVILEAPAVREPCEVAAEHAEAVARTGRSAWRDR